MEENKNTVNNEKSYTLDTGIESGENRVANYIQIKDQPQDKGGFLWGLLGCCVPIAGLVLFLVWNEQKPKTAKAAGIGALVSVVAYIALFVIYFFIMTLLIGIGCAFA